MKHEVLNETNPYGQPKWLTTCPVCESKNRGEGWNPHDSQVVCVHCGVHYTALLKDFNDDYKNSVIDAARRRKEKFRNG